MRQTVEHPLSPIYDEHSRILILGTMPSPMSRQRAFYYAHPQNRFWQILCALLGRPPVGDNNARRSLCLSHGIALWDVLQSCTIEGASDASIRDAVPNNIAQILAIADIQAIFTTGQTAGRFYHRLCEHSTGKPAIVLPSPSAANAAMRLDTLIERYQILLPYLGEVPTCI
ncbi:MAG: DNA-deoxyinosine glycosylase [Negativicutes bacterium]|nr:DNA-deoxyinosine glycosylase [Negativicutes bacterium]WMJ82557.1 DNA-deoxyinosine glycosylase [Oscillospiraceae bacterium MB24-C1]